MVVFDLQCGISCALFGSFFIATLSSKGGEGLLEDLGTGPTVLAEICNNQVRF